MSQIFYNPATRPNAPCRKCTGIAEIDDFKRPFYEMAKEMGKVYGSKAEMLEKYTYAGSAYFMENGVPYSCYMRQPFEFIAVSAENHHDSGINWGTEYFCTKEEAEEFYNSLCGQKDEIRYDEEYDVYSIHHHY